MAVRESYSIKSDKPRGSAPGIVKLFVFLLFWLCFGFSLGTVTLLYPVRWWATLCRERGFSHGFESGGVVTLILLLVAASMSLALWAATTWTRTRSISVRLFLPVFAVGLAWYAYSFWINPASMQANMSAEVQASGQFTFGPFPDQAKLSQLRSEGYTAVISLLHPAVVPFEPQLIKREEEEAKAAGIELIHLPMLPWVSDNADSIARLRELASKKEGRYYIHCYLGTDRVNVARRIIEQESGGAVTVAGSPSGRRLLSAQSMFERGEIYRIADDVFLTPYPTDEEFLTFILSGQVNHVVAMLDREGESGGMWIDREQKLFEQYSMPLDLVEVGLSTYDPNKMLDAVALVRNAKKPVVVHAFLAVSSGRSPVAEAFIQAYFSGKPPLPPGFFQGDLTNGPVDVVAPNVAVGPEPSGREWRAFLFERGIRTVVFAGGGSDAGGRAAAEDAGLAWQTADSVEAAVKLVEQGGPYYVYGPLATEAKQAIADKFGPAMPPARRNAS